LGSGVPVIAQAMVEMQGVDKSGEFGKKIKRVDLISTSDRQWTHI
jgi:hypothetical protein